MVETARLDPKTAAYWTPWRRHFVLGVLCLTAVFNLIDRQILSILLQPIKEEFGASDTQMGLLTGLMFAGFYVTASVPLARLADTFPRRTVIALCLGFWSVMTSLGGFAQSFWQLALTRIGVAVGEAGSGPASHSMISDLYPHHQRGAAIGFFAGMSTIGIGLSTFLGGWLTDNFDWRTALLVIGAPGVVLAVLMRFAIQDPPRGLAEARPIEAAPAQPMGRVFRRLWSMPSYRMLLAVVGIGGLAGYGTLGWGPTFMMRVHGMSATEVGLGFGLTTAAALFIGCYANGAIADWAGRKDIRGYMWVAGAGPLLSLPFAAGFIFLPDPRWALASYFVMQVLEAPHNNCSITAAMALTPVRMRATASVLMAVTVTLVGIGVAPLLVGIANDLLAPRLGQEAVRYTLFAIQMIGFGGAGLAALAATRWIRADHARTQAEAAAA